MGKYIFHRENWNFERIMNSVNTVEFLVLVKALNKDNELFVVLLKQTTCEMKTLQVYIHEWFYEERGAKFICWWVTLLK